MKKEEKEMLESLLQIKTALFVIIGLLIFMLGVIADIVILPGLMSLFLLTIAYIGYVKGRRILN